MGRRCRPPSRNSSHAGGGVHPKMEPSAAGIAMCGRSPARQDSIRKRGAPTARSTNFAERQRSAAPRTTGTDPVTRAGLHEPTRRTHGVRSTSPHPAFLAKRFTRRTLSRALPIRPVERAADTRASGGEPPATGPSSRTSRPDRNARLHSGDSGAMPRDSRPGLH